MNPDERGIKIISPRRASPPNRASSPPYEQPLRWKASQNIFHLVWDRHFIFNRAEINYTMNSIDFYCTGKYLHWKGKSFLKTAIVGVCTTR